MAAILEDEPVALETIQPSAPKELDRFLSTCLAKDPDDRWQDVRDVLREIRWIRENSRKLMPVKPGRPKALKVIAAVQALLVAALAGVVAFQYFHSTPSPVTRFGVIVFAPGSFTGPLLRVPADGGKPEPATEMDARYARSDPPRAKRQTHHCVSA